ncbi:hypothetical protein HID58_078452 [Brassica napus]|uniref:Uncharacterized protein n=1 Tax=Brassica napus TaxID=3708 RepID=A0ABQ7YU34_BRANA|nr:hypothetical protein HID58_078452 [Brassica napus]
MWHHPYWLLMVIFDMVLLSSRESFFPTQVSRFRWVSDGVCQPSFKFGGLSLSLQSVVVVSSVYCYDGLVRFHSKEFLKPLLPSFRVWVCLKLTRSWFWQKILDLLMFIGMPRLETSRLWQNTWVVIIYITFSSLASKRCLDQIKLNAKNTLSSKAWYHGASTERALEAMCLSYANWIGELQKMYAN